MIYGTIGSISSGTMRAEDLIPTFSYELKCLVRDNLIKGDEFEAQRFLDLVSEADAIEDFDCDETDWILEELFDHLDEFSPPYCHFGAHENDGADYGFWPSIEAMEDDVHGGSLLKVDDLADVPADYEGDVMLVNDHGNVTYGYQAKGEFTSVWACV